MFYNYKATILIIALLKKSNVDPSDGQSCLFSAACWCHLLCNNLKKVKSAERSTCVRVTTNSSARPSDVGAPSSSSAPGSPLTADANRLPVRTKRTSGRRYATQLSETVFRPWWLTKKRKTKMAQKDTLLHLFAGG